MQHASPAPADAVSPAASPALAASPAGPYARLRQAAEPASLLLMVALAAAAVNFGLLVTSYRDLFVHPDNHQFILKEGLRDGLAIGWRDIPNSFQLRAEGESRPRWLTYFFLALDHKLRLTLYEWMPVHPTLTPLAWLLELVVGPYYLYRLLLNLTGDRLAGLAGVAVFLSATGFLSGFSMHFMPGKPLSNTVLILALYAASEAVKALQRRREASRADGRGQAAAPAATGGLLVDAPGLSKYLILVWLFVGLFLDEMPIASFIVLPLMFWSWFVPRWPWRLAHLPAFVKNGLFFAIPAVAFLVMVVVAAPPLTQYLFGFTFDYLGDTLLIHGNTRTAASLEVAVKSGFDPDVLLGNLSTLFGLSLVPWQVSPLVYSLNGMFPSSQVDNLPKIVVLTLFFGVAIAVAVRSRGALAVHLRGLLVALPLFMLFLSLLMVRHIPVVTGYYYGAIFASLFALVVGLLVAGASQIVPAARPVAALAVLAIVGVQIVNYAQLNEGWRIIHNEQLTRQRMEKAQAARDRRIPIAPEPRDLTRAEVQAIWSAWKQGRLDRYLRDHSVSAAAVYQVVELQELDRARQRR